MMQSLAGRPWSVVSLSVDWVERTSDAGVRQRMRQMSASVERTVDPWSVAMWSVVFTNAPSSVTDLAAYIGDGGDQPPHQVTFQGVWQTSGLHTSFDGRAAHISMSLWQYTGIWEDIPTA